MNESREPLPSWERALRPRKSSNRVLVWLAAAGAAVMVFVAFQSWQDRDALRNQATRQGAPVVSPQPHVSESPSPDAPREQDQGPAPRIQQFAKCVSANGTVTYSDRPCPSGSKTGAVSVQPDANLADGMSLEDRAASMRRNSAITHAAVEHERRVAMNVDLAVTECAQLDAQIASIDAATRQPLNGYEQDRLRDQRKRARDRQFALRCR
ncbi:DUF4124 domain-containing protein [Variovorax sp. J2P1-59]|uniref:DUF4124 domain-containing protein n=1 Tax=Variovorax flavidus TaxID=3053501 RepID=UPI00257620FA|nr:DUF4124 domain-containing protein [Variovorax sp. J2P1-59]MDM0077447.1 DUF4124 domain-containing protein [Variovorax sp. J2P1-59]